MDLCLQYAKWVRFLTATPLPYELVRLLIWLFPHPRRCKKTVAGITFALDLGDLLQSNIYVEGIWEREFSAWWIYFASLSQNIADVGGHMGYYSFLASRFSPAATVHAFEPNPRMQAQFKDNLALNGGNIRLIEQAVGSKKDTLTMYLREGVELGTGSFSKIPHADKSISVPVDTLDHYFDSLNIDSVELVKIDIEGAEIHALQGMQQGLASNRYKIILIEVHAHLLPDGSEEYLQQYFASFDYSIFAWGYPAMYRVTDQLLTCSNLIMISNSDLHQFSEDGNTIVLPEKFREFLFGSATGLIDDPSD